MISFEHKRHNTNFQDIMCNFQRNVIHFVEYDFLKYFHKGMLLSLFIPVASKMGIL